MSKFGWSLPAGCNTLPGEEPESPIALKCPKCGRFLKMEVTRVEPWEESYINDDPRFGPIGERVILAADFTQFYDCSRCGEVNNPSPVFV